MANTKSRTRATVNKDIVDQSVVSSEQISDSKPIVAKEIDPEQYVTVINGFQGQLVYKSPRTGEKFVWDKYGSEQEMQLRELRNAKNTYKKYYINNWFMFNENWVVDYLGVAQYYANTIPVDRFDEIFTKPASEIEKILSNLSDGQKRSVAYRAGELIKNGDIDSRKTITTLEKCLNITLIDD